MGFKLAGIMMVIVALMGALGYWYYTDTQERMAVLQQNNAKLEGAVQLNEATITAMQMDYDRLAATNEELNAEFNAIRRQNAVLADKLSKHDLGVLGASKPGLVERVIDNASSKAGRCFEIISGAELTEKELNAKDGKAFNSECPWLYDTYVVPQRVQSVPESSTSTAN
jgi:FtsZ-binding cell division protein ZapB